MDPLEVRVKRASEKIEKILEVEQLALIPVNNPSLQFHDVYKPVIDTTISTPPPIQFKK